MSACDVRQETEQHPEFAEQIERIAPRVIPVVEEVTGLLLGPRPVIRLLSPVAWVQAVVDHQARVNARDIAHFDMSDDEILQLDARLTALEAELRYIWMGAAGATIEDGNGIAQVLMAPEMLHHNGYEEPELMKVLAHELTRVGQHRAGEGAAFHAQLTSVPHWWGLEQLRPSFFLSGHARWADTEVTTRLIGWEVPVGSTGRETALCRRMHEEAVARYQGAADQNGAPRPPGPPQSAYDEGSQWVRTAVKEVGVTVLNRAWQDVTLMPTVAEIDNQRLWFQRINPADTSGR
ncbi:hypothetical protein ACFWY6_01030 [Streptomyces sp. NPDC059037]|uniref:hypothetical protein n=1 Tax=Streptomyces sp. NPDC059037 TaxID=3346710 RepID=UPI0036AA09C5